MSDFNDSIQPLWATTRELTPNFPVSIEEITAEFEKLTEDQAAVVKSRFLDGLSVAQTAAVLNKTANNVKIHQHRAVTKLRRKFS